uniref:Uncharacterized protein n=1 Tax=Anguilla anguilla TaxID=7936 RepID=A0A0E9QQE6_ANGAN
MRKGYIKNRKCF